MSSKILKRTKHSAIKWKEKAKIRAKKNSVLRKQLLQTQESRNTWRQKYYPTRDQLNGLHKEEGHKTDQVCLKLKVARHQ